MKDKLEEAYIEIEESKTENQKLFQLVDDAEKERGEFVKLKSQIAQIQAENESQQKLIDYYKDDALPEITIANKKLQQKYKELEKTLTDLKEENERLGARVNDKQSNKEELERLENRLKEANLQIAQRTDIEKTLKAKFDGLLGQISETNDQLKFKNDQIC